jgi:hypothetical protein
MRAVKLAHLEWLMWSQGHLVEDRPMSQSGHSLPIYSAPAPINVRCYSNSDMIVRRSEVTLRATFGLMHRSKMQPICSLGR